MYKLLFLLLFIPVFSTAQDKQLFVEGVSPNLYLNHKVLPKENFYSIGRIYNISPRDIAPFNKLQLESGLTPGQNLKIPINSGFFQTGNAEADETFIPVYHAVNDKEGLYRVAQNYNGLSLETLKQWNNIKGESVKKGTVLIIGYLKVKKDLSALVKNGIGTVIQSNGAAVAQTPAKNIQTEKQPDTKKAETAATVKIQQPEPAKEEVSPAKKETVKKATESEEAVNESKNKSTKKIKGGAFKPLYEDQGKTGEVLNEEGMAGIFKSTSGWTDKRYYCLHNTAAPGTIIKITNPSNNKFVFAKVLDLMPDIQQNSNLTIIISNAAADELGVAENNFNCLLNYSK